MICVPANIGKATHFLDRNKKEKRIRVRLAACKAGMGRDRDKSASCADAQQSRTGRTAAAPKTQAALVGGRSPTERYTNTYAHSRH